MYSPHYPKLEMQKEQAGFSLLEISIVILILGIMALVVIPDSSPGNQQKLDLAVQEFAAAIRFARSEASRLGEPRGFYEESSALRIRVFRADTGTSPWTPVYDVYHPVSKKLYDLELSGHSIAAVDSIVVARNFRAGCNQPGFIYFDGSGVARCIDPETVLLQQLDFTFALDGYSRVVNLDGISGQVSIQ